MLFKTNIMRDGREIIVYEVGKNHSVTAEMKRNGKYEMFVVPAVCTNRNAYRMCGTGILYNRQEFKDLGTMHKWVKGLKKNLECK